MEWFLWAAPVPGAVEIELGNALSCIGWLVAAIPLLLARRNLATKVARRSRRLQVFDGGRALSGNPA